MGDQAKRFSDAKRVGPGEVYKYRGQLYGQLGYYWAERVSGWPERVWVFESHCADCGAPFTIDKFDTDERLAPIRRCEAHAKPGVRVRRVAQPRASKTACGRGGVAGRV